MDVPPKDLVDLDDVTAEFIRLLKGCHQEEAPRIVVASDSSGRGKSSLLRKLHDKAAWSDVPSALIALDEIRGDQFDLIEGLAEQLGTHPTISFSKFNPLNTARRLKRAEDLLRLQSDLARSTGSVSLQEVTFRGGTQEISGIRSGRIENLNVELHGHTPWTPGHEAEARRACVEAFFLDLPECSGGRPFAVLIDSVDVKASDTLREWVLRDFIRNRLIHSIGRACPWVVVIAGRPDLGDAISEHFLDRYADWIWSVPDSLGCWTTEHVRKLMEIHVDTNIDENHLSWLENLIKSERYPLDSVIGIARLLRAT
jgi:hypothetical protein